MNGSHKIPLPPERYVPPEWPCVPGKIRSCWEFGRITQLSPKSVDALVPTGLRGRTFERQFARNKVRVLRKHHGSPTVDQSIESQPSSSIVEGLIRSPVPWQFFSPRPGRIQNKKSSLLDLHTIEFLFHQACVVDITTCIFLPARYHIFTR